MAPLIVDDMVIAGVAGADEGIRGFVAAFKPDNGALVWRHWTVPRSGEPGIETWQGKEPVTGGGSTWLTGSYDAVIRYALLGHRQSLARLRRSSTAPATISIPIAFSRSMRKPAISNGTTSSRRMICRDRDATEPNVLVDTTYRGKPSKLLLHADRNGFFYVLDRTDGKAASGQAVPAPCGLGFGHRSRWPAGGERSARLPGDAANWDSTAFSPETRLYYFLALEECVGDKPGGYPDETGQRFLRALNIETGDIVWEIPQPGAARAPRPGPAFSPRPEA